jgi:hypothetical protein
MGKFKISVDPVGRVKWEAMEFTGSACKEKAGFLHRLSNESDQVTEDKPELYAEETEKMQQTI